MKKFHIKTRIYKSGKITLSVNLRKKRVGTITFMDIDQPAFYILYLNVDDKYMNKGIGTFLIKESIRQAISRGCTAVSLYVKTDNDNAIRFYKRLGFFISLTTKKKNNDHYLMTKILYTTIH